MERRAAHRSDGFGPGQHVDAAAADMGLVRMDGFGDQHAAAQAIEQPRGQRRFAARVAERDVIAIGDPERGFAPNITERHRVAIGDGKA